MAPLGCTWGAQGDHFGSLGVSGGSPGGSLGLPWRSLGSSGGVPGDPGGVLGAALGDFGSHWDEHPAKRSPGSMWIAPHVHKKVEKGSPKEPILGGKIASKSHKNLNSILIAFFRVPGHPRSKSCIFIGGLFKIEG